MDNPFLGMIALFGFNFEVRGWAYCNGQLMSIAQNTALFSLLGTYYGGDGRTTFALPDLRGRVPIHFGQGLGLSDYVLGQVSGVESTTLTINNMPAHNHTLNAVSEPGDTSAPAGALLGYTGALDKEYKASGTLVQMNPAAIGVSGANVPLDVLQPYLVLNYCIALEGIYPSRN